MPEPFRMMMRSESSSATSALLVPNTVQASWMMCSAEQQQNSSCNVHSQSTWSTETRSRSLCVALYHLGHLPVAHPEASGLMSRDLSLLGKNAAERYGGQVNIRGTLSC